MALTRMKISSGSPWESTFGYSRAVRVADQVFVGAVLIDPAYVLEIEADAVIG
jgi:hypothetical protein